MKEKLAILAVSTVLSLSTLAYVQQGPECDVNWKPSENSKVSTIVFTTGHLHQSATRLVSDTGTSIMDPQLRHCIVLSDESDYLSIMSEEMVKGVQIHALDGDDTINLTSGNNIVYAQAGDDVVHGGSGNDKIYGGPGKNIIDGGAGNDYLIGGPDKDTITGGEGDDTIHAGGGDDVIKSYGHKCAFNERNFIYGSNGDDAVFSCKWDFVIEDVSLIRNFLQNKP